MVGDRERVRRVVGVSEGGVWFYGQCIIPIRLHICSRVRVIGEMLSSFVAKDVNAILGLTVFLVRCYA